MSPFEGGDPTRHEMIVLAVAPKVAASLSILGSLYIFYDCLVGFQQHSNNHNFLRIRQDHSTYHRLMMGLSLCDISMSIGLFTTTWPMPQDTTDELVWGAMGTVHTCQVIGFLEQAGVAAVLYNASLSFYYLLRIRYGWHPRYFFGQTATRGRHGSTCYCKNLEVWLHAVPILFGLVTMIAGIPLTLYNSGIFDCWIAPFPQGCTESWRNPNVTAEDYIPCERGDNASLYQWGFDVIPKWSSVLIVTWNMFLTHRALLQQEQKTRRYSVHNNSKALSRSLAAAAAAQHSSSLASSTTTAGQPQQQGPWSSNISFTTSDNNNENTDTTGGSSSKQHSQQQQTSNMDSASAMSSTVSHPSLKQIRFRSSSTNNNNKSCSGRHRSKQSPALRLARQSYLYVGALYITYIPVVITRLTQLLSGKVYYEMLLTISITIPLQGFWNLIVYLRPRFLKHREAVRQERRRHQQRLQQQAQQPQPQQEMSPEQGLVVSPSSSHDRSGSGISGILHAMAVSLQEGDLSEVDLLSLSDDEDDDDDQDTGEVEVIARQQCIIEEEQEEEEEEANESETACAATNQ